MTTKYVQAPEMTLQSSISDVATEAVLTGFVDLSGVPLVQTDFGTLGYGTFEPNTDREEAVAFVVTSNPSGTATLTLTRGLRGKAPYGAGGTAFPHNASTKFVISNNPDLLNKLTAKDNDEIVTGSWSFPETPTVDTNPVTKGHYDDTAVKLTGAQSVAGVKTFTDSPIVPAADAAGEAINKGQFDAEAVKLTGNQTIAGTKTFSSSPVVPTAVNPTDAINKSQVEAFVANNSGDILASNTAFGTTKLDVAADVPADPKALTATANRVAAMSGGGDFGTPGVANKFVTETKLEDRLSDILIPQVVTFATPSPSLGGDRTTRFDITKVSNTIRYTWDGTGTNPNITSSNPSVGTTLFIQSSNFNANNNGVFVVTNSGTNFFEVTNAAGVAEADKTLTENGYIIRSNTNWTKDAGLKYIVVEGVGGGGGCDSAGEGAGSGGGYFKKTIPASSLGATEAIIVGNVGASAALDVDRTVGQGTSFGLHCRTTGGSKNEGTGGIAVGGDINIQGQAGASGSSGTGGNYPIGGTSVLGLSGMFEKNATGYGVGANGGGLGTAGVIIVTEYYT